MAVKFETRVDPSLFANSRPCKTSHRNKCNINETSRLFAKAVEISRSDEKFASAKTRKTKTRFFLGEIINFQLLYLD